ncbi:hypothetical protein OIE66_07530 [Nonomuraea sp. NBC_01738]|uniref:hypothetical protein n=1 Tax=Nonomuraea sp. NBC_01738 TaxID=2976003 RepID=UPI002E12A695|nr:hypothetical protein OIE66_07530 [Nonomuraea sp. NBC_01738]
MSFHPLLRTLQPGAAAQAAGIARGYAGPPARTVGVRYGPARMRCASLLKPLYAWAAAGFIRDVARWRMHAEPAISYSSNVDTLNLWLSVGPPEILRVLAERTGVSWTPFPGDPTRFGSVEVSAEEVATAYAALGQAALAGDPVADEVVRLMQEVPEGQSFGARRAVCSAGAPIKCGWYGGPDETCLRTHAVALMLHRGMRVVVAVAMTAQPFTDPAERAIYAEQIDEGEPVEHHHEKVGGELLRGLLSRTVDELGEGPDGRSELRAARK